MKKTFIVKELNHGGYVMNDEKREDIFGYGNIETAIADTVLNFLKNCKSNFCIVTIEESDEDNKGK